MPLRGFARAPAPSRRPGGGAGRLPWLLLLLGHAVACAGLALGLPGAAAGAGPAARTIQPSELLQALPVQLDGRPRVALQLRQHTAQGRASSQVTAHYGSGADAVRVRVVDAKDDAAPVGTGPISGHGREDAQPSRRPSRLRVVLDNGLVVQLEAHSASAAQLRGWLAQLDLAALRSLRPSAGP